MFRSVKEYGFPSVLLLALVVLPAILISCNGVMGMGNPIDWEPPVLTLDPGPNPLYVSQRTVISGTVTDNVAVDRVICRDATDPSKIYGKASISGDHWSMTMNFTEADNGRKIPVEIVAYDKIGNSGEESIKTINLIVDVHPPIFDEVMIWRSASRTAALETFADLKALETSDPRGDKVQNVDRYQNGAFWIRAEITENETTVKQIELNIYDTDYPNDVLYNETRDSASSVYSPQWTIKESDLISRGVGRNYEARLAAGGRIYFRVEVIARDMADNENVWHDDLGDFCLYRNADIPKAVIGGGMGQYVDVRTPIPVDIFDDDSLQTAYVALLEKSVFDAKFNGSGVNDEAKYAAIKTGIIDGTLKDYKGESIADRVTGTPDSLAVNVIAGEGEADYGDYMLVGIVEDVKSEPHTEPYTDTSTTDGRSVWGYYSYPITITDNNSPLIVIDTVDTTKPIGTGPDYYDASNHPGRDIIPAASTGNSPEENTFPYMLPSNPPKVPEAGRYFTINGYTLRANKDHLAGVGVQVFRMAWIPYASGAQDTYLDAVKTALRNNTPSDWSSLEDVGVQYWNLSTYTDTSKASYWIKGTDQVIGGENYTKQAFFKQFDILGGPDDLKPTVYDNFTSTKGNPATFENEPKLFVFYAVDQDNHEAFRTLRLLGNKTPPALKVYDLTAKTALSVIDSFVPSDYDPSIQGGYYNEVRDAGLLATDADLAEPFTAYPANQVHKLYVTAKEGDDRGIQIEEIKMYNITDGAAGPANERGFYSAANRDLTYVSALPDILQRTFLFTARNRLGVEVQVQRTVAVTNTAQMREIIADKAGGNETSYSAGTHILLQAQFSMPVQVKTAGPKPLLNIRYQVPAGTPDSVFDGTKYWIYTSVPFSGTITGGTSAPALYLDFDWTVPAGAEGVLETIDESNSWDSFDRPLDLNGAQIIDAERIQDNAFLPVYMLTDWHSGQHSLQGNGTAQYPGKVILLDGIMPKVTEFVSEADGSKAPYTGEPNHWYFKSGDIIYFTLTASKPIRTSGNGDPRIQFQIQESGGTTRGPYYADYLWPAGSSKMVFAVEVDDIPFTAGQLPYGGTMINIALNTADGGITDTWGNALDITGMALPSDTRLVVDKTPPPNATPRLRKLSSDDIPDSPPSASPAINKLNYNPILSISDIATLTQEPWGTFAQYSLDDGLSWVNYPDEKAGWTNLDVNNDLRIYSTTDSQGSQWKLRTRQLDKAGNMSALSATYELDIKGVFPKLIFINVENPSAIYTQGPITFTLDFDAPVRTTLSAADPARAYIVLSNNDAATATETDDTRQDTVKVYANRQTTASGSLTFTWDPINKDTKQMPNGLTVTKIFLNGDVVDEYGNLGVESRTTALYGSAMSPGKVTMYADTTNDSDKVYTVNNLNGAGVQVYTIPPKLTATVPGNAAAVGTGTPLWNGAAWVPSGVGDVTTAVLGVADETDGNLRKTITLTFNAAVRKDTGTIVIRPHGTYPIPPVFPAEGYTMGDGTYVESFWEVYNSSGMDATNQGYLLQGTYQNPSLDLRTGLYTGPYKLTTNGLKLGAGYTGANATSSTTPNTPTPTYTNTAGAAATGWNTVGTNYMVPDTSSKYVLDYNSSITDNTTTVNNIRAALNKARFRWQEIDVISSNVTIDATGKIVTIKLDSPLPAGMQWDMYYPEGTFVDLASLKVAQLGETPPGITPVSGTPFWFWTAGVQTPVIRVDRKSMDYRSVANRINNYDYVTDPGASAKGAPGGNDTSFDNIYFKMESETPGAIITFATLKGGASNDDTYTGTGYYANGGINFNSFSGNVTNSAPATNWNAAYTSTGTWVLPNLIRRGITGRTGTSASGGPLAGNSYNITENGVTQLIQGLGNLRLLRSYNADALKSALDGLVLGDAPTGGESNIGGIPALMASKNYVVARAGISHPAKAVGVAQDVLSARGYEGVFKTVVILNTPDTTGKKPYDNKKYFANGNGDTPIQIVGSNTQSPGPSIAGFPLMLQNADLRYLKLPHRNGDQISWISTEIVSSWYMQFASTQNMADLSSRPFMVFGEAGSYLTGGYGDLTHSYNQDVVD